MTPALEPCPFCGGEAAPQHLRWGVWMAGCKNDDCPACPETRAPSKAKAIRLWNHRTHGEASEVVELRKQRLMILAAVYAEAPRFVASICDEKLDRSGKLLGEVRELARAALSDRSKQEE
jgi:hypothetical protein